MQDESGRRKIVRTNEGQVRCLHAQADFPILPRIRKGQHHFQHIRRPVLPRRPPEPTRRCWAQDVIPLVPGIRRHVHIHQRELPACAFDRS
jgi:hypothetical protein